MGRYYDGDISGKFMFAVQSSDAADRFGSAGHNNYLNYYFEEEHLDTINEELELLKPDYEKVLNFYEERRKKGELGYIDEDLEKAGLSEEQNSNYADYILGKKIKDCIEEQGYCEFTAEL